MTVARDSELLGKRDRALGTKTFSLERPVDFDYAPGQFAFFSIPADEAAEKWTLHHFTVSSSPTEQRVEFTTRMTGHPFKARLDALAPGTSVRLDGPHGEFTPRPGMETLCYVCGGIGITPARSTVRWALDTGSGLDILVLYASRDLASRAFAEEFDAIESERIRVLDVLSDPPPGWSGLSGHIDAGFVREHVPDLDRRHFFVSGQPGFVKALSGTLSTEVGVPSERLTYEDFTGYQ